MKYIKIHEELDFSKLNPKKWTKREQLKSKIKNLKLPNVSKIEIKDFYIRGVKQDKFEALLFLKNTNIKFDWTIDGVAVRLVVDVNNDTMSSNVVVFVDGGNIPERVRSPKTGIFSINTSSKYGFNIWLNGLGWDGHTIGGSEFEHSVIVGNGGRKEQFNPKDIGTKINEVFRDYIPLLLRDIRENFPTFLSDVEKKIVEHKKKSDELALRLSLIHI